LTEIIEHGRYYLWVRLLVADPTWPRIIERRADSLGTVAARVHLERLASGDGTTPDLGWTIRAPELRHFRTARRERELNEAAFAHPFSQGDAAWLTGPTCEVRFPDAALWHRGQLVIRRVAGGGEVLYRRCLAGDHVPHQEAAWRTAAFTVAPAGATAWNALLEPPHEVSIPAACLDAVYHCGLPLELSAWPALEGLSRFHRDAMVNSALAGDDLGNVTAHPAGPFGMNRLNHCPAIFDQYYRSGDGRLREVALHWCQNFHDLSVWWGTRRPGEFGGTRYNNAQVMGAHREDRSFMWRSNSAVHFCTKGFDAFLNAYEETGDPRMATALRWQKDYAGRAIHADRRGESRNIGVVLDFLRLYQAGGNLADLAHALRLFRELRPCLSADNLFDQCNKPIETRLPFIDDDTAGLEHGYAKPYLIGYALEGLPGLLAVCPEEPKLGDVVRGVADFLASAVDPAGGWRYPHPRSRSLLVSQGLEHAVQLVRAGRVLERRGEPIANLLDTIECVLQSYLLGWRKTGQFFSGVNGWEEQAGLLTGGKRIYDLYARPEDRDTTRDYTEGPVSCGYAPPEGIVYFWEVLDFYLAARPAERLFHANAKLKILLERLPSPVAASVGAARTVASAVKVGAVAATGAAVWGPPSGAYLGYGMADGLPTFYRAHLKRLAFPLACDPARWPDIAVWRREARAKLLECLLAPPPRADFCPVVLAKEDRGSYEARKLSLSISADCRIPAYLLVPKQARRSPAILALHDHGAHFSIGKEKVIRPFGCAPEVLADARHWVDKYYGGRFIGDELAQRGYVVFSIDALFWGERGCKEGVSYESQQQLAANLLQLGMCWSGVITWDDIRSTEFVASLSEVDPQRIGTVGLSMGSHRAWMLAAASDRISAGAAICWMGTTGSLIVPGNNQTLGQSAFSMLVPNLRNFLDYPHVASIACPKPMLFFNGMQDKLFPVPGVNDAYVQMHRVWESRKAADCLRTRLWDGPHEFNRLMQEEVFQWFNRWLKPGS
jgi:dienelactone hydrolase